MVRTILREWWEDTWDIVTTFLAALALAVTLASLTSGYWSPTPPPPPTGVQVFDEIASLMPPVNNDPAQNNGLYPPQEQSVG